MYKGGMTVDLAEIKEKPYYFSNRALKRLIAPMIIEQFLAILVGMGSMQFRVSLWWIIFSFC